MRVLTGDRTPLLRAGLAGSSVRGSGWVTAGLSGALRFASQGIGRKGDFSSYSERLSGVCVVGAAGLIV